MDSCFHIDLRPSSMSQASVVAGIFCQLTTVGLVEMVEEIEVLNRMKYGNGTH